MFQLGMTKKNDKIPTIATRWRSRLEKNCFLACNRALYRLQRCISESHQARAGVLFEKRRSSLAPSLFKLETKKAFYDLNTFAFH